MNKQLFLKFGIVTLPFFMTWIFAMFNPSKLMHFVSTDYYFNPPEGFSFFIVDSIYQFIVLGISVYISIRLGKIHYKSMMVVLVTICEYREKEIR